MARRTKQITIETGRDKGKRFEITEMSAFDAEMFMMRIMSLTGSDGGGSFLSGGLNISGLLAHLNHKDGAELYDSLLSCVKIIPGANDSIKRDIDKEDIEEFTTLFKLRTEALSIITGFTVPDGQ